MRPTAYRRNARGPRDRQAFEQVRMQAGALFAAGRSQGEVARQLGVARQNVSRWHARWQAGGLEALGSDGPTGQAPRLSDAQLAAIDQALREGARAHGFDTDHWTLARVTSLIEQLTGFHHQVGAYNTDTLIQALGELRGFLGGQKVTLVWDGLPAHHSRAMGAWLRRQRSWLVVEPLPGSAPDLNPVEVLWSSLKGVELANLAGDTLEEVTKAAQRGIQRIRDTHHLAYSFLRHCGLSLW
jgi:transposase